MDHRCALDNKKKRRKKGRMGRETAIDVSFWGKRGVVGERDYGEVFSCAHKWSFFGILIAVRDGGCVQRLGVSRVLRGC